MIYMKDMILTATLDSIKADEHFKEVKCRECVEQFYIFPFRTEPTSPR